MVAVVGDLVVFIFFRKSNQLAHLASGSINNNQILINLNFKYERTLEIREFTVEWRLYKLTPNGAPSFN